MTKRSQPRVVTDPVVVARPHREGPTAPPDPPVQRADDALPELVESIGDAAPAARRVALASGRVVEAADGGPEGDRVTIRGRGGEVELEVRMTANGPVLRFKAADLELAAAGEVKVECDRFHVRANKEILEETGGHLRQRVAGNASVMVRGQHSTKAGEARIEAKRGSVQIEANDNVQLVGERIKMNC